MKWFGWWENVSLLSVFTISSVHQVFSLLDFTVFTVPLSIVHVHNLISTVRVSAVLFSTVCLYCLCLFSPSLVFSSLSVSTGPVFTVCISEFKVK